MQDYKLLKASDLLSASRGTINNNLESVKSNFSGTYFPTQDLVEGMFCWRTDIKKMYQLEADLTTWKLLYDLSGNDGVLVKNSTNAVYATKDAEGNNIADTYYRQDLLAQLKDDLYPVGSVLITMTATNPSTYLGGEWQQIAGGRTLIGASTGYTAGSTGGSENQSITLTTDNMPNHNHNISMSASVDAVGNHTHTRGSMNITGHCHALDLVNNYSGAFYRGGSTVAGGYGGPGEYYYAKQVFDASRTWTGETSAAGWHTHNIRTSVSSVAVGNGQAFNVDHMQPYLVTYIWQKVKKAFN